jgi:hypothetical protein
MKNKLLVTQINIPPGITVYVSEYNERFLLVTIYGKYREIRLGMEEMKPLWNGFC